MNMLNTTGVSTALVLHIGSAGAQALGWPVQGMDIEQIQQKASPVTERLKYKGSAEIQGEDERCACSACNKDDWVGEENLLIYLSTG